MLDTVKMLPVPTNDLAAVKEALYLVRQAADRLCRVADRAEDVKVEKAADAAFEELQRLEQVIVNLEATVLECE